MNNSLKKNICAKRGLSCHYRTFFSIKCSLELSKEPYASYIEPQLTLFFKSVNIAIFVLRLSMTHKGLSILLISIN